MIAYPVKKRMDAENYKKLVEITDLVLCTETLNLNANSKETVTNQLKCYNAILEIILGKKGSD